MIKYSCFNLHWIVGVTVVSLNTYSIYSVIFWGNTRRPGGKGTIEVWSCIKSLTFLEKLPPHSNRIFHLSFYWNWYNATQIDFLTNINLTIQIHTTLTLRIWIIIHIWIIIYNPSWHRSCLQIWKNKPFDMVLVIHPKGSITNNFSGGSYIHRGSVG